MPAEQKVIDPDLSDFQVPMQPIPERVEAAIARGVEAGRDMPLESAGDMLTVPEGAKIDNVHRNSDGLLVVCCHTDMPNVLPNMWTWWFGWHMPSSARYRLWHPKDHVRSQINFDQAAADRHRSKYIGQASMVDEYIGGKMQKLTIAFQPPADFGLDQDEVDRQGVAICARTELRTPPMAAGRLIHLVRRTNAGSEMLSRFWLGNVNVEVPFVGTILDPILNTRSMRHVLATDQMGLALLRHCSEEMNHLARILPDLFGRFGAAE